MEIHRVRAFRAIVELGGLTRAASVLHVTPSALSKSMQRLEDEVGRSLFEREGRGLRLTEQGKRLYHASAELLEAHGRALRALDLATDEAAERTVRLTSFEVFTTHCLAAMAEHEALSDCALTVLDLRVGEMEAAVAEGRADVGITYVPVPRPGLVFTRVAEISFRVYVRRGAFAGARFGEIPFAIPTASIEATLGDVLGIDCWPVQRASRLVRYRLTCMESALALCRDGRCAVFLPRFVAGLHNVSMPRRRQLVARRGPRALGQVTRPVHLICREGDRDSPALAAVREALVAAMARGEGVAEG
ncbi:MAG: LysR family transcriptional regulator [Myxococcales bacterium]|nr:LysR family transcriptional regulator [Myxococcales bacterium]